MRGITQSTNFQKRNIMGNVLIRRDVKKLWNGKLLIQKHLGIYMVTS